MQLRKDEKGLSGPLASSPEALLRMQRHRRGSAKPELLVRRIIRKLGPRYRVPNKDLPGSPDIANRSQHWAVFVHGCFWHHHEEYPRATVQKANRRWWLAKFAANAARNERKQ